MAVASPDRGVRRQWGYVWGSLARLSWTELDGLGWTGLGWAGLGGPHLCRQGSFARGEGGALSIWRHDDGGGGPGARALVFAADFYDSLATRMDDGNGFFFFADVISRHRPMASH